MPGPPDDPGAVLAAMLGQQIILDAAARAQQKELEKIVDREGAAGLLHRGVTAWNMWRLLAPEQWIDVGAVDLRGASLRGARLNRTSLIGADLRGASLQGAYLTSAHLTGVKFDGADLTDAYLRDSDMNSASFVDANLTGAKLMRSMAIGADFSGAHMRGCELRFANLTIANLSRADLTGAELTHALLVGTTVEGASLSGSQVYGISAWDLKGEPKDQLDLVITPRPPPEVPKVTVDDLRVAQLIYVMLSSGEIRNVIDTVTSKAVVILGRFGEHLKVLHAIRDELRRRNYLPIVFDFEQPGNRDLTETIVTLAHLARFVIADLSDPRGVPHELMATIPTLPSVAFQPIVREGASVYANYDHLRRYPWVLPVFTYRDPDHLIASLEESIVVPVEAKVGELRQTIRPSAPPPRRARPPAAPAPAAAPPLPSHLLDDARAQLGDIARSRLSADDEEALRLLLTQPEAVTRAPRSAADHLFLGTCYEKAADLYGALAEYSAAVGVDPALAEAHFHRARIHHQLGQLDRAIEDNGRAAALRPGFSAAHFNRGIAFRTRREFDQAVAEFSRVIAAGDAAGGHHARGCTHSLAGHHEAALADYREALRLAPDRADTHELHGMTLEQLGDDAGAVTAYQRAIDLDGETPLRLLARARVQAKSGASEEAAQGFRRVLDLGGAADRYRGEAHHGRGLARRDLGDLDGAVDDYTRALDLLAGAERADVHADRGFALSAQGRYDDAIRDYDRALTLNPDHVPALYNRACAFSLAQTPASILADLRRAIELNPSLSTHALSDSELTWARAHLPALATLLPPS